MTIVQEITYQVMIFLLKTDIPEVYHTPIDRKSEKRNYYEDKDRLLDGRQVLKTYLISQFLKLFLVFLDN